MACNMGRISKFYKPCTLVQMGCEICNKEIYAILLEIFFRQIIKIILFLLILLLLFFVVSYENPYLALFPTFFLGLSQRISSSMGFVSTRKVRVAKAPSTSRQNQLVEERVTPRQKPYPSGEKVDQLRKMVRPRILQDLRWRSKSNKSKQKLIYVYLPIQLVGDVVSLPMRTGMLGRCTIRILQWEQRPKMLLHNFLGMKKTMRMGVMLRGPLRHFLIHHIYNVYGLIY